MVTAQERAILRKAAEIKRAKNRETRMRIAAARKPGGKQHRGRERDAGYLQYLRRQPCRIGLVAPGSCNGPIEACHVRYGDAARGKINPGLQCKPSDRYATSCCAHHHREQHAHGNEPGWWASYGLNGLDEADKQYAAYQGGGDA